jgi:hypothetical protein
MASDTEYRDGFPDVTDRIYHHWSSSDFENTASSLWQLKIFKPIGKVENNWAYYFVFDCDLKDAGSRRDPELAVGSAAEQADRKFHRLV